MALSEFAQKAILMSVIEAATQRQIPSEAIEEIAQELLDLDLINIERLAEVEGGN